MNADPSAAACRTVPLDTHYPTAARGSRVYARQVARAKAVCVRCPIRDACLSYALAIEEPHGVWGGLDEYERSTLADTRPLAS